MAATVTVIHLLKAADHIICTDATSIYFSEVATRFGLEISFVECSQTELLEAAITPEAKVETPTDSNLKMIDIEACACSVHKHGEIILAVDNTFMSAHFQWPLSLGANVCMSSATNYMNGHTDVVMGFVSVNSEAVSSRLHFLQHTLGAVPLPFDCNLCSRGLKNLPMHMDKHFENGLAVAQFLESNPRVENVVYPNMLI